MMGEKRLEVRLKTNKREDSKKKLKGHDG